MAESNAADLLPTEGNDTDLAKRSQEVLLPEVLEALQQEGSRVDVNVLLVQLVQKAQDPNAIVQSSEKLLGLAEKFELQRVENFLRMANAMIDVKTRDPDELEKRRNNQVRRYLKGVVGACAVGCLGGGILSASLGGSIVTVALLVAAGSIALAMTGPLAAGESMSSNDVVRIVSAMRWLLTGRKDEAPAKRRKKE